MSRLRIRVMGYVGSGKTTLIELLAERLRALGLQFIVRGEEDDNTSGTTSERVEALRERETLVEIESVHLRTPLRRTEAQKRCPHDGGFCHHSCEGDECFREAAGMHLTRPHEGYPLPGHNIGNGPGEERPVRSFVFGEDHWWHPVGEDGTVYESMRYDAEAVLSGYLPGVTIHIHSPEGS